MSKPKHTPGWTTYKAGSFKILVDQSCDLEIGQLSCTESEANLIAAAPEMLEALELLVEQFNPNSQSIYEFARQDWNQAKAAIKKAKGEL